MLIPGTMLSVESKKIEQVSITAFDFQEALDYVKVHRLAIQKVIPKTDSEILSWEILAVRDVALVEVA